MPFSCSVATPQLTPNSEYSDSSCPHPHPLPFAQFNAIFRTVRTALRFAPVPQDSPLCLDAVRPRHAFGNYCSVIRPRRDTLPSDIGRMMRIEAGYV